MSSSNWKTAKQIAPYYGVQAQDISSALISLRLLDSQGSLTPHAQQREEFKIHESQEGTVVRMRIPEIYDLLDQQSSLQRGDYSSQRTASLANRYYKLVQESVHCCKRASLFNKAIVKYGTWVISQVDQILFEKYGYIEKQRKYIPTRQSMWEIPVTAYQVQETTEVTTQHSETVLTAEKGHWICLKNQKPIIVLQDSLFKRNFQYSGEYFYPARKKSDR